MRKENEEKLSPPSSILTLPLLQDFFFEEMFCSPVPLAYFLVFFLYSFFNLPQVLILIYLSILLLPILIFSNFIKYFSSNFLSSYPYNNFTIYFPGNSPLLKSLSFTISIFSCFLTSVFILPLNSSNTSFTFPKSSLLF